MFSGLITCLLVFGGAQAIYLPTWRTDEKQEVPTNVQKIELHKEQPQGKMIFGDFDFKNLNPANWFSRSEDDEVEKKMDELYGLVKCLIEDNKDSCEDKLVATKSLFEKKKKDKKQKAEKDDKKPSEDIKHKDPEKYEDFNHNNDKVKHENKEKPSKPTANTWNGDGKKDMLFMRMGGEAENNSQTTEPTLTTLN